MKITKQRLKEIIREELYRDEDAMYGADIGVTEPRHEGGTPEERLLNKLLIRSKVADAPDAVAAAEMLGLGEDEEVVAYLDSLMGNPMYDSPGLEEATPEGYPMTNKQKRAEIGLPDPGEEGEESSVLHAPKSQREIDRLAYGARTGRWRKKRSWDK